MSRALVTGFILSLVSAPTIAAESSPRAAPGLVEGAVNFPGCHVPTDLEICAEAAGRPGSAVCVAPQLPNTSHSKQIVGPRYQLELPPGRYLVFARAASVDSEYRAYFSRAVTCGLGLSCTDHEPEVVFVRSRRTTKNVSPSDWVAPEHEPLPSTLALAH